MNLVAVVQKDESGQGLAEAALLIAFIALVCFLAVQEMGGTLNQLYEKITNDFPG